MDPEVIVGGSSAVLGLVTFGFRWLRGLDRRLRRLELGVARIEAHLGVDARDSIVGVSVAPESGD